MRQKVRKRRQNLAVVKKRRKNYLPSLVLMVVLWGLWGGMIYMVEPELVKDVIIPGAYLPFFMLFFPASFLSLAILLGNSRRGLLVALGVNGFLLLRVFQMGSWLNLVLIGGMVVVADRYWS